MYRLAMETLTPLPGGAFLYRCLDAVE